MFGAHVLDRCQEQVYQGSQRVQLSIYRGFYCLESVTLKLQLYSQSKRQSHACLGFISLCAFTTLFIVFRNKFWERIAYEIKEKSVYIKFIYVNS